MPILRLSKVKKQCGPQDKEYKESDEFVVYSYIYVLSPYMRFFAYFLFEYKLLWFYFTTEVQWTNLDFLYEK